MKASKTESGWELTFCWGEVLRIVLQAIVELLKDGGEKKPLPAGGLKIRVDRSEGTIENSQSAAEETIAGA